MRKCTMYTHDASVYILRKYGELFCRYRDSRRYFLSRLVTVPYTDPTRRRSRFPFSSITFPGILHMLRCKPPKYHIIPRASHVRNKGNRCTMRRALSIIILRLHIYSDSLLSSSSSAFFFFRFRIAQ